MGAEDGRLYLINGLSMVVSFFLSRCVWGSVLSWWVWQDMGRELELGAAGIEGTMPSWMVWTARTSNVALHALNWWWFSKMASKAGAVLVGGKRASQVHSGKED